MVTSSQIKHALASRHSRDFFITEVKDGPSGEGYLRMDAVALAKSWAHPSITGYEVKVARRDFINDTKWPHYLKYCNRFYFACPSEGVITREDIKSMDNSSVGLLYVNSNGRTRIVVKCVTRPVEYDPMFLMYIIMTRLDNRQYPFFSSKRAYFEEFVASKISGRELAYQVRTALVAKLGEAEDKVRRVERKEKNIEEIKIELEKYGISDIRQLGKAVQHIDLLLSIDGGYKTLHNLLVTLRRIKQSIPDDLPNW